MEPRDIDDMAAQLLYSVNHGRVYSA
jgi:hypothetical protein